jgi:hypothetical protein
MNLLLELIFGQVHRRLRRLGLLGSLVGMFLAVYVELPLVISSRMSQIDAIIRSVHAAIERGAKAARVEDKLSLPRARVSDLDTARSSPTHSRNSKK